MLDRVNDRMGLKPDRLAADTAYGIGSPERKDVDEHARDMARSLANTELFERSRRERKKVEMLFAHLKRMRFERLRLRGITGASDEFLLAATAQNLRRLARSISPPGH